MKNDVNRESKKEFVPISFKFEFLLIMNLVNEWQYPNVQPYELIPFIDIIVSGNCISVMPAEWKAAESITSRKGGNLIFVNLEQI